MGVLQPNTGNDEQTVTKDVVIENKLGLHARPAAMFVRIANQFPCEVSVEKDNEQVNGKSIMGLMMLAAGSGSHLKIHASGEKAADAVAALESLIAKKFDEE